MNPSSKKRKIELITPETSNQPELNWNLCFICQIENSKPLQCPTNNAVKKSSPIDTYTSLGNNIIKLHKLNALPFTLYHDIINQGSSLGNHLNSNNAKFHKDCKRYFQNDRIAKAELRAQNKVLSDDANNINTRCSTRQPVVENKTPLCFFCDKPEDKKKKLHRVRTFKLDSKVRRAAIDIDDTVLYSKLQNGDMCAQDADYHTECLCKLYRDAQNKRIGSRIDETKKMLHGLALSKVISFINESLRSMDPDAIPLFKLADLVKHYNDYLDQNGVKDNHVHSTRLKIRIMEHFDDMYEQQQGRDIILGFYSDLSDVISSASKSDFDNEGLVLAEASRIIRRDILEMSDEDFSGSFSENCQEDSFPNSLKCFLSTVLAGNSSNPHHKQTVLTIGQLIRFNTLKRTRQHSSSNFHSKDRETPLPIFIAEYIHAKTRNIGMIEDLSKLGLSISKARWLQLSTNLGNASIDTYEQNNVVAPTCLERNLFCTSAIDNIDVNTKAVHSKGSLHGTAASINTHPVLESGIKQEVASFDQNQKKLRKLPHTYIDIEPFQLPDVTPTDTNYDGTKSIPTDYELNEDLEWLKSDLPWAVYHSSNEILPQTLKKDQSALLPIWKDDSKSPATIRHILKIIKRAVHFLNPEQSAIVSTLDQPLYAIAKSLQWYRPTEFGPTKYIFILGSLHVEMAMVSAIGDWLDGSGWLEILSRSNVTGPGNNALLTGKQVALSKYTHQVTAMTLNRLMKASYENSGEQEDFSKWRSDMESSCPLFQFWSITLKMEMTLLLFTRSIRSRNFNLYRYSLHQLLPWMFSLDHYHYARWLSIHAFDMDILEEINPDIFKEFHENGNFVVARTLNKFSSMGMDQRHEQLNADAKGNGGFSGLTEDDDKLLRWMVCGPEEARLVNEFKETSVLGIKDDDSFRRHHDDCNSIRELFKKDVRNLEKEFLELGNPFQNGISTLYNIVSNDIAADEVMKSVSNIESLGKNQKEKFFKMIRNNPSTFLDPIQKNSLPLMGKVSKKIGQNKTKDKESKEHLHLFSQLYVATQVRGGDMDDFFKHETLPYPPSLSISGNLRSGEKSGLLNNLKGLVTNIEYELPNADGIVIDGPVVTNQIQPSKNMSFYEYTKDLLYPYLVKYQSRANALRLDVVFDTYPEVSLKGETRLKRGVGTRRRVHSNSLIPSNWKDFLRSSDNKIELFRYLSLEIKRLSSEKIICGYDDTITLTSENLNISPTDHEEADTRIFLHLSDMIRKGHKSVIIRTVDTDVIIIAISLFNDLNLDFLWIDFGSGKTRFIMPIHEISLDSIRRRGLRFFYCFTGCDQVSFFAHVSKQTAWKVWQVYPEINEVFALLSEEPSENEILDSLTKIERFVVLLYHRTSNSTSVNQCRKDLFCNGRALDNLPPTRSALLQHVKRAVYISGYVWSRSCQSMMNLPSFKDFGFQENGMPFWSALPDASHGVRKLTKCGCKSACKGNCKCRKMKLKCTELCHCKATCN